MSLNVFTVGVSERKIILPTGYPMGGYSVYGEHGIGQWGDLSITTMIFNNNLIWVTYDWWTSSRLVKKKVYTELIEKQIVSIAYEELVISTTHTHHTPGNIDESSFYNKYASCENGFNQTIFNYLSNEIVLSIIEAIRNKKETYIAYNYLIHRNLVTNRSLEAYLSNNKEYELVNTTLNGEGTLKPTSIIIPILLFYHRNEIDPYHILLNIASHPTMNGVNYKLYSADVFGVIRCRLKKMFKKYKERTVTVSIVNGCSGDVTFPSDYNIKHTILTGENIATVLYNFIVNRTHYTLENNGNDSVKVEYREIHLPGYDVKKQSSSSEVLKKSISEYTALQEESVHLSTVPIPGFSQILGANEKGASKSKLFQKFFSRGAKTVFRNGSQGSKRDVLDFSWKGLFTPFTRKITEKIVKGIPTTAEILLIKIGQLYIFTTPFEMTRMMEFDLLSIFHSRLSKDNYLMIVNHTNHYLSYCTTEEEYECQLYEGASNLYGKYTCNAIYDTLRSIIRKNNYYPDEETSYQSRIDTIKIEDRLIYQHSIVQKEIDLIDSLFYLLDLMVIYEEIILCMDIKSSTGVREIFDSSEIEDYYKCSINDSKKDRMIGLIFLPSKYHFNDCSRIFTVNKIVFNVKPHFKLKVIDSTAIIYNLAFDTIDELKHYLQQGLFTPL